MHGKDKRMGTKCLTCPLLMGAAFLKINLVVEEHEGTGPYSRPYILLEDEMRVHPFFQSL